MSTILTVSVSLPDWGNPSKGEFEGCRDHSDKVKDSNPETPDDPCGGEEVTPGLVEVQRISLDFEILRKRENNSSLTP